MKNALVGYTGFVGSNLLVNGEFEGLYNSKNVLEAYGTKPELLIYTGLPAEKFLANKNPKADLKIIEQAKNNIERIDPQRIVLISTVDVLRDTRGRDEDALVDTDDLQPYGLHRFYLEKWVQDNFNNVSIIRLPGLYGVNLKKNFIYDFINVIPQMLSESKYEELLAKEKKLQDYYCLQENGFYSCRDITKADRQTLKEIFSSLGFTALNFTDSRNTYQFYPLSRLWSDIQIVIEKEIKVFHPATEPVSTGELYQFLSGNQFTNEILDKVVSYDYRTKYCEYFGGKGGYIMNKKQIMDDIKNFVGEYR